MSEPVPVWVAETVREMDAVEDALPTPDWLEDGAPRWQENVGWKLLQPALPFARPLPGTNWNPSLLGMLLGIVTGWREILIELCDVLENDSTQEIPQAQLAAIRDLSPKLRELVERRQELAKRASARALDAPAGERAEFFEGLMKGLRAAGRDPADFVQTDTLIVFLLLACRKKLSEFDRLPSLHEWLCSILGPRIVGSRKRLEKLCERIGLKFRDRGRPRQ